MRGFLVLAGLISVAACSTSSTLPASADADSGHVAKVIGASGGSVTSSDKRITLTVPPNALTHDLTITLDLAASPIAGAIGQTYEIGPTGTTFIKAPTLVLTFTEAEIAGNWAQDLLIGTIASGKWTPSSPAVIDEIASTVTATTTHFSPFGLIVVPHDWSDAGRDAE